MSSFRKILVPTDFSPHAQEAFRVAHDLAKATGATVVVFHVFRPPADGIGWRPATVGRGPGRNEGRMGRTTEDPGEGFQRSMSNMM